MAVKRAARLPVRLRFSQPGIVLHNRPRAVVRVCHDGDVRQDRFDQGIRETFIQTGERTDIAQFEICRTVLRSTVSH